MADESGSNGLEVVDPGSDDFTRWAWTKLARDILYGCWEKQLERRIDHQVGSTRKGKWKNADLSANLLKESSTELACLFDEEPNIVQNDAAQLEAMKGVIDDAILWPLMQTVERDARALGNVLVRIDNSSGEFIRYRIVFPDMCIAKANPDDPTVPVMLRWARERDLKGFGRVWCWDEYDIRDKANPTYRVLTVAHAKEAERDVTTEVLGSSYSGKAYPYVWTQGERKDQPFIPFVKFDARRSSDLWNWRDNVELVEGTLQNGVYWTFFGHNLRMGSFRQKYGINVTVPGANRGAMGGDSKAPAEVVPDSANIILFDVADPDAGQAVLGEFDVPVDPEKYIGAVSNFERRVVSKAAGIKPASAVRTDGTPTSGYTFALSNAEKRAVQARIKPMFEAGCIELLEKTAAMSNASGVTTLPEDGWAIEFTGIPLSADEREAIRKDVADQMAQGLMGPVEAYQRLNPGATREQAMAALEQIRRDRAQFT